MKAKILFLFLLIGPFSFSQGIKEKDLPVKTIGNLHDYIIVNDSASGTASTKRMDLLHIKSVYFPEMGTVKSFTVATVNGVSATVANSTSIAVATFSLSAITPTTINGNKLATGTATITATGATSISGTNTGDQTISDATIATTDITTNNFTTSKHGFVPKGTNVGNFLKDDGTWAVATPDLSAYVTYSLATNPVDLNGQYIQDISRLNIGIPDATLNAYTYVDKSINAGQYIWRNSNTSNAEPFIFLRGGAGAIGTGTSGGGQIRGSQTVEALIFSNPLSTTDWMRIETGLVGIGTAATTPLARLHVKGQGSTIGTFTGKFFNSSGLASLQIRDDGCVFNYGAGGLTSNTAYGSEALINNTSGIQNAAYGHVAMELNTTGGSNTAYGYVALSTNTDGSSNTAIGRAAMSLAASCNYCTAIGEVALQNNTGNYNAAGGYYSMQANTSGINNSAWGVSSMQLNQTGNGNAAFGFKSLYASVSVSNCAAFGKQALFNNIAANNTGCGSEAFFSNTSGTANTGVGYGAFNSSVTASNNTGVGYLSFLVATGGNNTGIGANAGLNLTTGTGNVFLGNGAGGQLTTQSNQLAIDNTNTLTPLIGGDFSTKSLIVGGRQLVTNATDGFLYIPTFTATPNGTPTSQTGAAPIGIDVTNNQLNYYSGGSWRQTASAGISHTIFTPTTGQTITLINNQYNIVNPSGALLALTINLPSTPSNNDLVYIKFTQNVTTVTYANGTVVDGITAPTAGGLTILTYDSGTTSWY